MIYTKTGEYAIRAILFLARQPNDILIKSSEVAKREDIPIHYLAKILQRMVKYGYVASSKGRSGGFRITELARKNSLLEIIERVEGSVINLKCITGLKECSEKYPCPLHTEWTELRNKIYTHISSKSVQEDADKYSETLKRVK